LWFVKLEPEEQLCRMLAREKLMGKMRARTIELLAFSDPLASVSGARQKS